MYLAIVTVSYEPGFVLGVFTSRREAERTIESAMKDRDYHYDGSSVVEIEVNEQVKVEI